MTESPERDASGKVVMLGRCPNCSKRAVLEYRPFCSKRCADLDLGRWLSGDYAIPAVESDDPDDEDHAPGNPDKF